MFTDSASVSVLDNLSVQTPLEQSTKCQIDGQINARVGLARQCFNES